jgi:hypothetical protein
MNGRVLGRPLRRFVAPPECAGLCFLIRHKAHRHRPQLGHSLSLSVLWPSPIVSTINGGALCREELF